MNALRLYAGPLAMRHLAQHGLRAQDVGVIPGAAGGPKGLVLGPLDRFIFGTWLAQSAQPVHLVGASIGAWRMATACLDDAVHAFERLERDYIAQHYAAPPGRQRPPAEQVSREFGRNLQAFYGGRVEQVLRHPRYRLHIVTSRGRGVLAREQPLRTALGFIGAYASNLAHRRALGAWLERVVFSTALPADESASAQPVQSVGAVAQAATALQDAAASGQGGGIDSHSNGAFLQAAGRAAPLAPLPFATTDYPSRQVPLTADNFMPALQASCSIPFALQAVHDIPGAPRGAYWDGGLTDYHLHLNYNAIDSIAKTPENTCRSTHFGPLVLYPHFQRAVVPGWLDKSLRRRHRASAFLDRMVLLAPSPEWVARLPGAKLPDRTDFTHYGTDLPARMAVWNTAVAASAQLADEFAAWLQRPDMAQVQPL